MVFLVSAGSLLKQVLMGRPTVDGHNHRGARTLDRNDALHSPSQHETTKKICTTFRADGALRVFPLSCARFRLPRRVCISRRREKSVSDHPTTPSCTLREACSFPRNQETERGRGLRAMRRVSGQKRGVRYSWRLGRGAE